MVGSCGELCYGTCMCARKRNTLQDTKGWDLRVVIINACVQSSSSGVGGSCGVGVRVGVVVGVSVGVGVGARMCARWWLEHNGKS